MRLALTFLFIIAILTNIWEYSVVSKIKELSIKEATDIADLKDHELRLATEVTQQQY